MRATRRDETRGDYAGHGHRYCTADRLISANGDCVNNFRRRRIARDYAYVRNVLMRDAHYFRILDCSPLSERARLLSQYRCQYQKYRLKYNAEVYDVRARNKQMIPTINTFSEYTKKRITWKMMN